MRVQAALRFMLVAVAALAPGAVLIGLASERPDLSRAAEWPREICSALALRSCSTPLQSDVGPLSSRWEDPPADQELKKPLVPWDDPPRTEAAASEIMDSKIMEQWSKDDRDKEEWRHSEPSNDSTWSEAPASRMMETGSSDLGEAAETGSLPATQEAASGSSESASEAISETAFEGSSSAGATDQRLQQPPLSQPIEEARPLPSSRYSSNKPVTPLRTTNSRTRISERDQSEMRANSMQRRSDRSFSRARARALERQVPKAVGQVKAPPASTRLRHAIVLPPSLLPLD
jgi:hypothetical protein